MRFTVCAVFLGHFAFPTSLKKTINFTPSSQVFLLRTSDSTMSQDLNADTSEGVIDLCSKISYYMNLRIAAKSHDQPDFPTPAAINQIIQLAISLPEPEKAGWGALAANKLPSMGKAKKAAGEGTSQRAEKLNDEQKQELVRLVEDEAYRSEVLGKEGTHQGHVNWTGLARRYGFATPAPIHRQYQNITGKDPPGVTKREKKEGGEPSPKKQKVEDHPAPAARTDGWTKAMCDELVKLIEDEDYRKIKTGKKHLKWSRVADNLDKGKKECKSKYTEITGKTLDD